MPRCSVEVSRSEAGVQGESCNVTYAGVGLRRWLHRDVSHSPLALLSSFAFAILRFTASYIIWRLSTLIGSYEHFESGRCPFVEARCLVEMSLRSFCIVNKQERYLLVAALASLTVRNHLSPSLLSIHDRELDYA